MTRPVYAILARDEHRIHFRLADPPKPNPDKYADEILDAYLFIEDSDVLYAEYVARGVEFTRAIDAPIVRTSACPPPQLCCFGATSRRSSLSSECERRRMNEVRTLLKEFS